MKKLIVCLMMLWFPAHALAEQLLFVCEAYPPYEYLENEQMVGVDTEILRAVCERLGIEPEFLARPWKRALYEVQTGQADAVYSLMYTAERAEFLYYPSEPLNVEKSVMIAKQGSGFTVAKIEDLQGKKVGVVVANSYGPEFDSYTGMKRVENNDNEVLLRTLEAGRIDVAVINELVYKFLSKRLNMEASFEILEYTTSIEPLYVGFSKTLGERGKMLAEQFSQILRELQAEGVVQQIMDKY